jgi:hypothetical protein
MPSTSIPGVTDVDLDAVRRAATWERVRNRTTLRGLLDASREPGDDSGVRPSSMEALDPPSLAVRLEMARLRDELEATAEAQALELQAAAGPAEAALPSDDQVQGGAP